MAEESPSSGFSRLWRRGVRAWAAAAGDALISIIFPGGCRICGELLADARRVPICDDCFSSFQRVPQPSCDICGRPLPALTRKEHEPLLCPACHDQTYAFDRARGFAIYEGPLV